MSFAASPQFRFKAKQSSQKTATDKRNLFLPYAPLGAKSYDDDDENNIQLIIC